MAATSSSTITGEDGLQPPSEDDSDEGATPGRVEGDPVVVIVGASSGIGAALAEVYAKKQGWALVLAARRVDRLEEVSSKCRELNSEARVSVFRTDVTVEAECRALVEHAVGTYGRLDVLLYVVGIAMHVKFADITDLSAVMRQVMDTNFTGAVYCVYAARAHLRASKGSFAVVSSVAGELSPPFLTFYAAAKHAINGFCESLNNENPGFSVTILCPGYVATELDDKKVVGDGSIQSVELNVDRSKYMPARKAASLIFSAVKSRKKVFHLTSSGSWAASLKNICPDLINSAIRKEMDSITKVNH
ncbi:MAG: SDR family oxidoreductase [archaeon]|nr:SDR family oxidoreductase [archaeon]